MSFIDLFAIFVLIALIGSAFAGLVWLGSFPGKVAAERKHAQKDAVRIAGWLGIVTLGIVWPLACIWAYWNSEEKGSSEKETLVALQSEIHQLQAKIEKIEQAASKPEEVTS